MHSSNSIFQFAHIKAKKILKDKIFWDPDEETGPFCFNKLELVEDFRIWRTNNLKQSPIQYLQNKLKETNWPEFDWLELDPIKIQNYIDTCNNNINSNKPEIKERIEIEDVEWDESLNLLFDKQMSMITSIFGDSVVSDINNNIISIGFGQFILEGFMENKLWNFTVLAVKREKLPMLLEKWYHLKSNRFKSLDLMLSSLNKIKYTGNTL